MTTDERIEEELNTLIRMHESRLGLYESAANQLAEDETAINFLNNSIENVKAQIKVLSGFVIYAGGMPQTSTTIAGKLYRSWLSLFETFSGHEPKMGLHACIKTNEEMIRCYDDILSAADSPLSVEMQEILEGQRKEIQLELENVKKIAGLNI